MKYRVTSRSVTVTGPPRSIWEMKVWITEPRVARTLPKRTLSQVPLSAVRPLRAVRPSAIRLLYPSTLCGSAALSVEMFTKCCTPWRCAASRTLWLPRTLVLNASSGDFSSMLTCLSAAAWKTTSG